MTGSTTSRSNRVLPNVLRVGFVVLLVPGCRGAANDPPAKPPPEPAAHEVPRYTVEEIRALSAIGDYLPELDEGRLRVAPPAGWDVASRSKDYIVRFVLDRDLPTPLPRITLEVEEADAEDPGRLDEENLSQFVERVASRLEDRARRDVAPLILGSVPCAHFVVKKGFRIGGKTIAAECDVLKTLRNGRLYTLTLDVYAGKLIDYRADAYVVMAHIEFLDRPEQPEEAGADSESDEPSESSGQ